MTGRRRCAEPESADLRQVAPGERLRHRADLVEAAAGDHASAVLSRAGAKVENLIGRPHHLGVVLHHQDRVSQVAQLVQNVDEPRGVAAVQPIDGSSSTYSVPTSREPSEVAS